MDDRNIHDSGQIPFRTAKLSNQRAFFPAPSLLWQFRERFLDFQKQIQAAKISTFEPEDIQTTDNFQSLDLTGENAEISFIPVGRFMNMMNQMLWANMGTQFTPFSQQYQETNDKYLFNGQGLTPYDVTGNISAPTELGEVLTA